MVNNALTLLEESVNLMLNLNGLLSAAVGPCRAEPSGDQRSSWGPEGRAWIGAFELQVIIFV